MLIEEVELTLSHVGLGPLNERALLLLFGSAFSHYITLDLGTSIRDIVDVQGQPLYPAYFYNYLRIPENRRLEHFQVWERVDVATEVRSFGGSILESHHALGRCGEIDENDTPEMWESRGLPTMSAGTFFVLDERRRNTGSPAVPKAGCITPLSKLGAAPKPFTRFNQAAEMKERVFGFEANRDAAEMEYQLVARRDFNPPHALMWAELVKLMEYAEQLMLVEHASPQYPRDLAQYTSLLERESFFFGNRSEEGTVRLRVEAKITAGTGKRLEVGEFYDLGRMEFVSKVEDPDGRLLIISNAKKLLAIPPEGTLIEEANALIK